MHGMSLLYSVQGTWLGRSRGALARAALAFGAAAYTAFSLGQPAPAAAGISTCPVITPWRGPIFDAMAQTNQEQGSDRIFQVAQSVGVLRMALFARTYRRQDGREVVAQLSRDHPGFLVVGSPKRFDMRGDLDSAYVSDTLNGVAAGRYAFVGEILYTHGDKEVGEQTSTGERYIDPLQPQTARLIQGLAGKQVPIFTHWEAYDWARDAPRFDTLYSRYPDQVFVWPHAGVASSSQLAGELQAHPNLWATLSKKENLRLGFSDARQAEALGAPLMDDCGVLDPAWLDVMVRFHDRLMFATDAHNSRRWSRYEEIVRTWRRLLAQLPADVAKEIAWGNAMRLFGGDSRATTVGSPIPASGKGDSAEGKK